MKFSTTHLYCHFNLLVNVGIQFFHIHLYHHSDVTRVDGEDREMDGAAAECIHLHPVLLFFHLPPSLLILGLMLTRVLRKRAG